MFVYPHLCSNNAIDFLALLGDHNINDLCIYMYKPSLSNYTAYTCTAICGHVYFWMKSSVCLVTASTHGNNMVWFPFLWTIQLALSGRLMESGLLDQCHGAFGIPTSLSTVLLPLSTHIHSNTLHLHFVIHTLFLTSHSRLLPSMQSIEERVHLDSSQTHQQFSSL